MFLDFILSLEVKYYLNSHLTGTDIVRGRLRRVGMQAIPKIDFTCTGKRLTQRRGVWLYNSNVRAYVK